MGKWPIEAMASSRQQKTHITNAMQIGGTNPPLSTRKIGRDILVATAAADVDPSIAPPKIIAKANPAQTNCYAETILETGRVDRAAVPQRELNPNTTDKC